MVIGCIALFAFLFLGTEENLQAVNLPADHIALVSGALPEILTLQGSDWLSKDIKLTLSPNILPYIREERRELWNSLQKRLPNLKSFRWVNPLYLRTPFGEKCNKVTAALISLPAPREPIIAKPPYDTTEKAPERGGEKPVVLTEVIAHFALTGMLSFVTGVLLNRVARKRRYISANVPHHLSLLASGIRGCSAAEMPEVPQA